MNNIKEKLGYFPDYNETSFPHLSDDGLQKPIEQFLRKCNPFDHVFHNFSGDFENRKKILKTKTISEQC